MKMRMLFSCFAILMFATPVHGASADQMDALGWLVGRWVGTEGATITVETWQRPLGGTMLGTNQTSRDGATLAFEFMRIETTADGVAFIAAPDGQAETSFHAVRMAPGELIVEAPEHDFPQRILYRRTGDILSVRIESLDGAQRREWIWRLSR